jgi:hypothetical protein
MSGGRGRWGRAGEYSHLLDEDKFIFHLRTFIDLIFIPSKERLGIKE